MIEQKARIRVGLIRCDTHGLYYGALMQEHDPLRLRTPLQTGETGPYSWQTGGAYYYLYTYYADPTVMTAPFVGGFEIARVWDEYPDAARCCARVFNDKPIVCSTVEDVSEDVDLVFIADCNGSGSDHLELAAPGIRRGVPTFIDKPFADNLRSAKAIIDLAKKNSCPVMSSSIVSEVPETLLFKSRLAELNGPKFGAVRGGSIHPAGLIHSISLATRLFGYGVESVEALGDAPQVFAHLNYGDSSDRPSGGVMLNCDAGPTYHCSFYASAYSEKGAVHSPNIGDFEFPGGAANILMKAQRMARTRVQPYPYDEMLENVAILDAIGLSLSERRKVLLREFYDE